MGSRLDRRKFINTTVGATLLAGTPLATATPGTSAASSTQVQGANGRIRMGLIGGGNRGNQVAGFFLRHPDCQFIAVAEPYKMRLDNSIANLTKLQTGVKVEGYEDYEAAARAQGHRRRSRRDARPLALPDHDRGVRRRQGRLRRETAVERDRTGRGKPSRPRANTIAS